MDALMVFKPNVSKAFHFVTFHRNLKYEISLIHPSKPKSGWYSSVDSSELQADA